MSGPSSIGPRSRQPLSAPPRELTTTPAVDTRESAATQTAPAPSEKPAPAPVPTEPAPRPTTETAEGAFKSHAFDPKASQLQASLLSRAPDQKWVIGQTMQSPRDPAEANEVVDIRSGDAKAQQEAKKALIAGAPQINPISEKAGNANSVCAGAAITNTLIMTDKNGENAKAMKNACLEKGVKLSADEQKALANFQSGKLTPTDVQHLQQVNYRLAVASDRGSPPKAGEAPTVEAEGVGRTMALLKGHGGFAGREEVNLHLTQMQGPGGKPYFHWTSSVDGTHMNSIPANLSSGPAQVKGKQPKDVPSSNTDPRWHGNVSLKPQDPGTLLEINSRKNGMPPGNYVNVRVYPPSQDANGWLKALTVLDAGKVGDGVSVSKKP